MSVLTLVINLRFFTPYHKLSRCYFLMSHVVEVQGNLTM